MTRIPHHSVLLHEVVQAFSGTHLSTFVDGTLGAGGHAQAILTAHPEIERYVGIDRDPHALAIAKERLAPWNDKVTLVRGVFASLETILDRLDVSLISGMLLDLGVSSMQFDVAERGFSFGKEGPLDMRMDPDTPMTAADILASASEEELGHLFREYGEEPRWRAAARCIVQARRQESITTTTQLVRLLRPLFPPHRRVRRSLHPLTLIFQALRIAVNGELSLLEETLPMAIGRLEAGGRLAVISFHRLEDRIVKRIFLDEASDKVTTSGLGDGLFSDKEPSVKVVTRKPLVPSDDEVEANPRSRSARLRVVQKL